MVAQEAMSSFGQMFATSELGDQRRTNRLVKIADGLWRHPGGTLPDKLKNPADLKALYRLARAKPVTHAAILEPARQQTLARMRAANGVVLKIHDTTELDYTGLTSLENELGQIGNGSRRGYLCHNTLAVLARTREVLGLANQILFVRPDAPANESRQSQRRRATRESRLWRRGAEAIGAPPEGGRWVDVCDRGADLFEYLDYKHARGEHYVIRSSHNRWISLENEGKTGRCKLHDWARALPELGRRTVAVPAREGQSARTAELRIAAAPVTIPAPAHPRGEHRDEALSLWVVIAVEIDPPAGVAPLEWILLTNVPVQTLADAEERIGWYTCRWIIEEYHKGQKTGCGVETLQFTRKERLEPVIALLSVVAVFLLQLRDLARQPERAAQPARTLLPEIYVDVLGRWRWKKTPEPDCTVAEFCYALARLGGHQNRKCDGAPGWLTLWRGWTKLQLMVEAVAHMHPKRCGQT